MSTFRTPDLTPDAQHAPILEAIKAVDDGADVNIDADARLITITSAAGDAAMLRALSEAGYPASLAS
ncbi:hypothetical protein AQS8620_00467 [Aquimixticola soesokkakensis]|uniref:HMA domain-containing protein n=1 Tax=Aquimixticola soesokkakensis TaxID=1519096 RepID=A0A1Y5RK19_9RHOB|nr:hypothetical protein [Aquimixticola soesokkakensis]SLN19439.1 hypothetical protein AQS8620_00467 [Aquimixticola soesokkakensis]